MGLNGEACISSGDVVCSPFTVLRVLYASPATALKNFVYATKIWEGPVTTQEVDVADVDMYRTSSSPANVVNVGNSAWIALQAAPMTDRSRWNQFEFCARKLRRMWTFRIINCEADRQSIYQSLKHELIQHAMEMSGIGRISYDIGAWSTVRGKSRLRKSEGLSLLRTDRRRRTSP